MLFGAKCAFCRVPTSERRLRVRSWFRFPSSPLSLWKITDECAEKAKSACSKNHQPYTISYHFFCSIPNLFYFFQYIKWSFDAQYIYLACLLAYVTSMPIEYISHLKNWLPLGVNDTHKASRQINNLSLSLQMGAQYMLSLYTALGVSCLCLKAAHVHHHYL